MGFCGRGSAPDPGGGAHDAPRDPVVSWGGGNPLHTQPPSAPQALRPSRLRRSLLGACRLRSLQLRTFGARQSTTQPLFFLSNTACTYFVTIVGRECMRPSHWGMDALASAMLFGNLVATCTQDVRGYGYIR